jgi:hypothetical protein
MKEIKQYIAFWAFVSCVLAVFGVWAVEEIAHAVRSLKEYRIDDHE